MNIEITNIKDSGFPAIDFCFMNKRNITAHLIEFRLKILNIEIDKSPVLNFVFDVEDSSGKSLYANSTGRLIITATNDGWGDFTGSLTLGNSILEDLFPAEDFHFDGTIRPGESTKIVILGPYRMNREKFTEIAEPKKFDPPYEESLSIKELSVSKIRVESSISPHGHALFLTSRGFVFEKHYLNYHLSILETAYCTLINVDEKNFEKKYRISRKVATGDIDRFHIQIGATKSSFINLKFQFIVDKDQIVDSEEFKIHIRNPQNSGLLDDFKDGGLLKNGEHNGNSCFLISGYSSK